MNLEHYWRQARKGTPRETLAAARRVASRHVFRAVDRAYVRWGADREARGAVNRAASRFGGLRGYVDDLRTRRDTRFFAGVEEMVAGSCSADRATVAALAESAEPLRQRRFQLLGMSVEFKNEIAWAIEPATGACWPTHEYHIDFLRRLAKRREDADVRRTWELNRFLHFPLLGRIHWQLQHGKDDWCTREFATQVDSWVDGNPYGRGPNWASTMDVSIRMLNFIWGYWSFRHAQSIPDRFWKRLAETIWQHARHIERHPQGAMISDNHHISHFLGLFYVGLLFPELPRAQRWLEQGRNGLIEQMRTQVYDDGIQHECTTNYQKFVAEMFLHAMLLAERNQCPFPAWYRDELCKMFTVLAELEQPDGLTPTIGDTDNGRLQDVASAKVPNDYRAVLTAGAVALARPHLLPRGGAVSELADTLCGASTDKTERTPTSFRQPQSRDTHSASFPKGGFFTVRSGNAHVVVRGGPFGLQGHGGHSHNDQLAFAYWYRRPIFVDPGILGYAGLDPELIAYFRSTAAHNTLCVDNTEQLPVPHGCFERPRYSPDSNRPIPRVIEGPNEGSPAWRLVLEHYYYQRIGVVHRRAFELNRGGRRLSVTDWIEGNRNHNLSWSFHLAAGLQAVPTTNGVTIRSGETEVGLLRIPRAVSDVVVMSATPRADAYGAVSYAPTVRLQLASALPTRVRFVFEAQRETHAGIARITSP